MTDLAGKVALVTGGSRGIGLGIVTALAAAGAKIVVVATSEASAQRGVDAAHAAGAEALAFAADVSDGDRASEVVKAVISQWGAVDVLVNNAGITRDMLLMKMSDEDIDRVIDVNLKGSLRWCRAVVRPMMKARAGSIINVSSIVALMGSPGQSNYAAAKAGMLGVTRSLAAELGGRGVRVNAIAPGYIQTDMTADLPDDLMQASLTRIPLGRLGLPEDIAKGVIFLASDQSSYITGTTLVIDGGMSL
ncbi:MAG: 3-oxoacyl-[acyl-carrier-protein] reductase [Planctomycetota bacterium]|nr:MAG: 3-oxoacyl-[acyl-carrier-protein] reductase [Planctomycetota bacterium]